MSEINLKYPNKKIKIVATIGPATWDPEVMKKMIEAGMNVARVNAAFADAQELEKVERLVRKWSNDVELMLDVKGPEIRMNEFEEPITLHKGKLIEVGNSADFHIYPINHPDVYKQIKIGQKILVGDGEISMIVVKITDNSFVAEVEYGELLKPGKALNFTGLTLAENPLTDHDKELIDFVRNRDWKHVSASFISTAENAQIVKDYMSGSKLQLTAKIEDQAGVDNIDSIMEVVDSIMVARGGLGVELGFEYVPFIERILIQKAKEHKKPVIVATQMLESMTVNPIPTRGEANDVATAILLGADTIMLSGESSAGKHPVEAVDFMSKVATVAEKYPQFKS